MSPRIKDKNIFILLSVYSPKLGYLIQQLESIQSQTYKEFMCLIRSDGQPSREILDFLIQLTARDPRFVLEQGEHVGSTTSFELLLKLAKLKGADVAFFADQDDIWHVDKIAKHLEIHLNQKPELVHSDLRAIDETETLICNSVHSFEGRNLNISNSLQGVLINQVTGCSASLNKELIDIVLPFPSQLQSNGIHHDAWIAAVSNAFGATHLISQPLIDYRQHAANQVGMIDRTISYPKIRQKIGAYKIRRVLAQNVISRLENRRVLPSDQSLTDFFQAPRLTLLKTYLKSVAERSPKSKLHKELLFGAIGSEIHTLLRSGSIKWSNLRIVGNEASSVINLVLSKNFRQTVRNKLKTLAENKSQESNVILIPKIDNFHFSNSSPEKVILLLPHLPPTPIYGGIQTALQFAGTLSKSLQIPLNIISVNQLISNEEVCLEQIERFFENAGVGQVDFFVNDFAEIVFYSANCLIVSTAWWTAIMAEEIAKKNRYRKNLYLIQDFEPGFYPWGANYVNAIRSYEGSFIPIFNTNLLRDYFANIDIKFFDALNFSPQPIRSSTPKAAVSSTKVKVVFYYRPNVARNSAELTLNALRYMIENVDRELPYELFSIGESHGELNVGKHVTSIGFLPYDEYLEFLASCNVGLSVMISPHPSYPPLDMAQVGLRVVSNRFGTKIHIPGIELCEPTPEALGQTLIKSVQSAKFDEKSVFKVESLGDLDISGVVDRIIPEITKL
jgi:hypothetical protein